MNREVKRNVNIQTGKSYNLNKQMSVDDLKAWSKDLEWPDENRINDIGRNHVDGAIYSELDSYKVK